MRSYKTAVEFGVVYIPIELYLCAKSNDIGFNLLYKKNNQRIKYKKTCKDCPKDIKNEDIVKGYEYQKGKYVTLTQKEIDDIKSKKEKTISIDKFVNLSEIDPIYFDKAYYVIPTSAEKAFVVLKKAMKQENKVAIAKTVFSNSEQLVAIREQNGNLILYTLHFFDEIQSVPKVINDISVTKQEIDLAKQIIENMTEHFDAKEYKDEFKQKLILAINKKIKGEQLKPSKIITPKNVINLMDALKQSVVASKKSPQKKSTKLKNKKSL